MTFLKKYSMIFLWAGILLLCIGGAIGFIESRFNYFSGSIFCLGVLALLLLGSVKAIQIKTSTPQTKQRIYFQLFFRILLLIVLFIAVNGLANRFDMRFDMTQNRQHTLTAQTKDLLAHLKQDITITVFFVGMPPSYLDDLLKEYTRHSHNHIKTEIIDPLVDIGYAAQFGNVISGQERKAIIRCGQERKNIDFTNIALNEKQLSEAIIKVTRQHRKVYFLAGHEEYDPLDSNPTGMSKLRELLESRNSSVHRLLLGAGNTIPKDCDVLVLAGPKNPISPNEEKVLANYLEGGGKALILLESLPLGTAEKPLSEIEKLKNPPLNSILNRWGITIGDDIVVDLENYAGEDVGCPVTKNYPKHKEIIKGLDYTFYIRPRSISFKKELPEDVLVAPLILTASRQNSWAETDRSLKVRFDEGIDTPGPIMIGSVLWGPKNVKRTNDTKIIVITDADFATNTFLGQYSNADLVLNSISWLSELDPTLNIPDRSVNVQNLNLSSKQRRIIVVILFMIPFAIVLAGCYLLRAK